MTAIRIKTISPISIPCFLKVGINTNSAEYVQLLHEIDQVDDNTFTFNADNGELEYKSLAQDVKDLRVFKWIDPESEYPLAIHVFPNVVGIVEVTLNLDAQLNKKQLEEASQALTSKLIKLSYQRFLSLLVSIDQKISHPYWHYKAPEKSSLPRQYWISRTLMFSTAQVQTHQNLISKWLSETKSPEEAEQIISGQRDYSMTWLNYVVVDVSNEEQSTQVDYRIDAMILAQYYYTTQENCNNQLKQAIDIAYRNKKIKQAEEKLSYSRVATRLHYISYHDQLKYLTRVKRNLLIEILDAWQFESLVENGQRMIDVCSDKLQSVDIQRRESSTMMTDLLLVALSFFTVFELSMSLTAFSREMMSRPTLDYNDDKSSSFLSFIANIDVDIMFSLGFALTLLLIIIYRIMKR